MRDWKTKGQKKFWNNGETEFLRLPWSGRPSMTSDEIVTEVKGNLHNACVTGKANTRKTVIEIGNGALISRCPEN